MSNTVIAIAALFLLLQASSNFAQGPFQGYVPDLVPEPQVGLASALLGFFQMGGSALYSIAVSRLYDGTALPMTGAIAASGLACLACSALLLRRAPAAATSSAG